jgi:hypothetical protein
MNIYLDPSPSSIDRLLQRTPSYEMLATPYVGDGGYVRFSSLCLANRDTMDAPYPIPSHTCTWKS